MILPSPKRLYSSDFPKEDQKLVDQLSYTVNTGFDSLFQLGNNNITLADNVSCTLATVNVTVDATGTPIKSVSYALTSPTTTNPTNPVGTIVIGAASNPPGTYPTGGVFVTTTKNSNSLTVVNVAGLPVGIQFSLTLLTFQS